MKKTTIHTSRTIMFPELEKVMNHGLETGRFLESLEDNVASKTTKSNIAKTNNYLKLLYSFNNDDQSFAGFKYFWQVASDSQRPIIALLFALGRDYLLSESIEVVLKTPVGEKAKIEKFKDNLELFHPSRFTYKTKLSVAQNIASSWKKAGYITGKVKNIRTKPAIGFVHVAFAMLLSYLSGDRGEFIMKSQGLRALELPEREIRELAFEASKRDLLEYQFSGNLTSISFNNLLKKLNIDGI
jgi:hypothetical protein